LKKAAQDSDDPEIRTRAAAALAQMKDHQDNDVSLITLHKKDAPAQEVLDAIGAQAHAQFIGSGFAGLAQQVTNRTLSIDADNKPFWDVLTDACTQLNVCPVLDSPVRNSMRLFPVARNWIAQSPHQIVGPYWIGVAGVYRTRSIDLMGPQSIDDQFSIRLIVYPEPKLAVTQMSDLKLLEATDDAGNSLMPRPQAQLQALAMTSAMMRASRPLSHTIDSKLSYPDQPGKRIALLRGEVTVMIAQGLQRYEVDDVLGTPKATNPLTHCTVKATVTKSGTGVSNFYSVTIECTRDGLSDEKWTAMINRMSDITLEDADGHALLPLQMIPTAMTDTTFTGRCIFSRTAIGGLARGPAFLQQPDAKIGEPKKLVWNVATNLKPVTVPILFKDLPMP
jgi:hypothetical protein